MLGVAQRVRQRHQGRLHRCGQGGFSGDAADHSCQYVSHLPWYLLLHQVDPPVPVEKEGGLLEELLVAISRRHFEYAIMSVIEILETKSYSLEQKSISLRALSCIAAEKQAQTAGFNAKLGSLVLEASLC
jgi:hypothetical protein